MTDQDRLPWFPCEPTKLLGALAGMKPQVGFVYLIVCLRIYETGGPIADPLESLARRTGYNKRVVSEALDTLFRGDRPKLVRAEGGGIMNPYAGEVLEAMKARSDKASEAGRVGASARHKKHQTNQTPPLATAMRSPERSHAHLQGQLELQEEGGGAPSAAPPASPRAARRSREFANRIQMPEGWHPDVTGMAYAAERGFVGDDVEGMIRKCRDRHIRVGTKIAGDRGLAATWRTWVDNEVRFRAEDAAKRRTNGSGRAAVYDIAAGRQL